MRVIFLDFDGVLNNESWIQGVIARRMNSGEPMRTCLDRDIEEIDPSKVKLVSDFCIEEEMYIAISSSWRGLMSFEDLKTILYTAGLNTEIPIIGVTPDNHNHHRGGEIERFINDTYMAIEDHVIFDDSTDFYSDQPLVKTTWEEGLLPSHITQAKELLNRKE